MMVALGPVKARRSELPPQCAQLLDVDIELAQNLLALRTYNEYFPLHPKDVPLQQAIS